MPGRCLCPLTEGNDKSVRKNQQQIDEKLLQRRRSDPHQAAKKMRTYTSNESAGTPAGAAAIAVTDRDCQARSRFRE
jgi:Tfp pilus assembly protein PilV